MDSIWPAFLSDRSSGQWLSYRPSSQLKTGLLRLDIPVGQRRAYMPLVTIDLVEGRSDEQLALLADTVYEVEHEVFAAPEDDRYIIITEHKPGRIFLGSTGLGYQRSPAAMVIRFTQQNRNREQKEALYRALCDRLHDAIGLRPEDLIVSIVANEIEDWSFGMGRAQFLTGELE